MPVNEPSSEYAAAMPGWRKSRDTIEGEEAIKQGGTRYLARLSGQSETAYRAYCNRAPFYNATQRTVDGLTGMIFRKAPKLEGMDQHKDLVKDVTAAGITLQAFCEEAVEEVIGLNRYGVLIDHPPMGARTMTQAQAQAQGVRPYLSGYKAENILSWSHIKDGASVKLSQVRLLEKETERVDEFTTKPIPQIRVLDLTEAGEYRQRVYRKDSHGIWQPIALTKINGQDQFEIFPMISGKRLRSIPFVFLNARGTQSDVMKPPLLDLVNVNLAHWRVSADLYHGAHYTGLPTPVVTGQDLDGKQLVIGGEAAWGLPNPEAKAFFLEFMGQGLGSLEKLLDRNEKLMAMLGARMLMDEKRGVEAADTARIQRVGENSVLSSIAQAVSDGIEKALRIMVEWAGGAADTVVFDLNRDFLPVPMSAADIVARLKAWQAGGIAFSDWIEQMKQGEVVSPERTAEDIQAENETTPPPGPDLDGDLSGTL